jgi:hypothetical protein
MRVEVETDETLGLSMPRKFHFDWRAVEVVEILDQWFGADHRYCKLKGGDGALYILRLDENRYEWSLTMLQARKRRRSPRAPAPAYIHIRQVSTN